MDTITVAVYPDIVSQACFAPCGHHGAVLIIIGNAVCEVINGRATGRVRVYIRFIHSRHLCPVGMLTTLFIVYLEGKAGSSTHCQRGHREAHGGTTQCGPACQVTDILIPSRHHIGDGDIVCDAWAVIVYCNRKGHPIPCIGGGLVNLFGEADICHRVHPCIPCQIILTRDQRGAYGCTGERIGITVFTLIASLVLAGQHIAHRRIKHDMVVAWGKVTEEILSTGIGTVCGTCIHAIFIEVYDHPCYSALTHILDTITVAVYPDIVSQACRLHKPKVKTMVVRTRSRDICSQYRGICIVTRSHAVTIIKVSITPLSCIGSSQLIGT